MYQQTNINLSGDDKDAIIREHKNTINLMLVYVITTLAITVLYFFISIAQRYLMSTSNGFSRSWDYMKYIYSFFHIIELALVIIIAALIKNSTVRIWFIIFAAVKLITSAYWLYTYFK